MVLSRSADISDLEDKGNSHVLMTVVAGPVSGLLVASSEPDQNLKILELQNLSSSRL